MARSLVEVNSPLASAYGIQHVERLPEDQEDGFWQLVWNTKADAEAAWEVWNSNENATAWAEETAEILSCDGENRFSFDAYIARANDTFGEFEPRVLFLNTISVYTRMGKKAKILEK